MVIKDKTLKRVNQCASYVNMLIYIHLKAHFGKISGRLIDSGGLCLPAIRNPPTLGLKYFVLKYKWWANSHTFQTYKYERSAAYTPYIIYYITCTNLQPELFLDSFYKSFNFNHFFYLSSSLPRLICFPNCQNYLPIPFICLNI